MRRILVSPKEMQTGDTVIRKDGREPWNTAIVKRVTKELVTLYRPYGTTADFEYTGGVICYVGIEEYDLPRADDERSFILAGRKVLK